MTANRILTIALWCAATMLGWLAYAPALSGTFLLDDFPNLAGLASVTDWQSAMAFSFSGTAGPLGRPLALLSFVPQAADWDHDPEPFLRVNILIHLANASLVCWIFHRLAVMQNLSTSRAAFAAVAGAALWLFMPLLASASLLIIQRMTTLAAFFSLLGISGYLLARSRIDRSPKEALAGMAVALMAGTALAVLTKENGALLPVFLLVLEATILQRPGRIEGKAWQAWKALFLVLPTVLILGFLLTRIPYGEDVVLRRDFTGWERLLTEARILWQYLFSAFFPQPWNMGPFHDGYAVSRTLLEPVTLAAVAGWLSLLFMGVAWRRRYPLLALGILWFLGGQLLESTTVPLDLYFEHRNYLPIIGPIYAMTAGVAAIAGPMKRIAYAGLSAYVALQALVLVSVTTLWGSPGEALLHWKDRFPGSRYAITAALPYYLAVEGPEETLRYLRMLAFEHPQFAYMRLYELNLSCEVSPEQDHGATVRGIGQALHDARYSPSTIALFSELLDHEDCNGVGNEAVEELALALLQNPRYRADATYNHMHHKLMALIRQEQGKSEQAVDHLKKAMEYVPSSAINLMMVMTYISQQRFDEAYSFIEQARSSAPLHPLRRYVWQKELDELDALLVSTELRAR